MTDLEIARSVTPKHIFEIAQALGISSDDLIPFGRYKAKIALNGFRTDPLDDIFWSQLLIRRRLEREKRPRQSD